MNITTTPITIQASATGEPVRATARKPRPAYVYHPGRKLDATHDGLQWRSLPAGIEQPA
jgi:hypothetical protein